VHVDAEGGTRPVRGRQRTVGRYGLTLGQSHPFSLPA